MTDELSGIRTLCRYLEMITTELETRIHQAQKDVAKMEDIYQAIRPLPNPNPEPKENEGIARLINLVHGTETKAKVERPAPADPFAQFQEALQRFTEIPVLRRDQYSRRFLSAIMNHTRKTPAHVLARLGPCARRLDLELDKVLRYDLEQPSSAYRASCIVDGATKVMETITRNMEQIGGFERIEPTIRERAEREPERRRRRDLQAQFETIADFREKQLCGLYRLRGRARSELMLARIREKMEEVVMPFLAAKQEEEEVETLTLKIAARAYTTLSCDARSYAIITAE
jgi:hypothetical protein